MGVFDMMNISSSGLTAERLRMDVISENIANADTTVTESGEPYRKKNVVFEQRTKKSFQIPMNDNSSKEMQVGNGVRVKKIVEDKSPFKKEYNPGHPNANEDGYVMKPNVSVVKEMTDMITASRAYEANVTVLNNAKGMANAALNIGK
ncbi:MAG: flagellar basal body rod protein FlgC [Fusobacteriota bacterium]